MPFQNLQDVGNIVARVDHDRLVGDLIADDGAVTGQQANGQNFVDHCG